MDIIIKFINTFLSDGYYSVIKRCMFYDNQQSPSVILFTSKDKQASYRAAIEYAKGEAEVYKNIPAYTDVFIEEHEDYIHIYYTIKDEMQEGYYIELEIAQNAMIFV